MAAQPLPVTSLQVSVMVWGTLMLLWIEAVVAGVLLSVFCTCTLTILDKTTGWADERKRSTVAPAAPVIDPAMALLPPFSIRNPALDMLPYAGKPALAIPLVPSEINTKVIKIVVMRVICIIVTPFGELLRFKNRLCGL
jgi:hypothetical protein